MKIKKIELEKVIGLNTKIPDLRKKEIVLAGRSNVGKSSFINTFANRINYARTSSTPGKTRTINYYNINDAFYLVDLPGYGYAKASMEEQNKWATFINKYLTTSQNIEEIFLIVDIRHEPSKNDKMMFDWICENTGYEPLVIATKLDKIKKSEKVKNLKVIKECFGIENDENLIAFSSETKEGLGEVNKIVDKIVNYND